ncbi:uncharacterized protein LOC120083923 [Benincasa hispida]|uniref:uncharacterized protein LOC120083923 n=1 Tax=Benincasa hispida TaxID=102211 RepID=UPI0019006B43|nr:uncharacterized protein LOC120083923 [Benincasa hispida]
MWPERIYMSEEGEQIEEVIRRKKEMELQLRSRIERTVQALFSTSSKPRGQITLALYLLLAVFSSKISSDVNRPFGDKFQAARKVSEEVGAQIILGDRPIEITLERAWNALTWTEVEFSKLCCSWNNIDSGGNGSSLKLYEKLSFSYLSLLQPLVHERNTYLVWSLKRSKAVNKSKGI